MSREGSPVRYVSGAYVPQDELLYLIYGAESRTAVASAMARAELPGERIPEATVPTPRRQRSSD